MTKGLVRSNNLSDIANKVVAVTNLGLAQEDYMALKGLYSTLGIDFTTISNIAKSSANFQAQIDAIGAKIGRAHV